ncbi:nitrate- and nitrite sensing domain-containing protein [Frankia sp. CNm7]|uniref:histidine kinase n=1 Tax=Frankia nepalensis TaxID=1836974 RepID=A0A937R7N8_9ACTN|nr:nitrate- and nitrite sensing domain-containing protein [Frankia nepalensis]MBL7501660.1 nitrate- and nitrite sensing domain-containing protein [Frankia nepalensis]MBL7512582.1 nitrate- and nitrite sensing domain-containing protein [Frankia nepalensis]MBL7519216.1 nitrate- and nitrite sensing domain-containing protein [Frankia nepalensis]MBL7627213.1 nitrate- and nitrite sensing domain-containing protein [Frankia nepalensis]
MASSTGVAADPMPMQAPGAPVIDDGGHGERPVAPRPAADGGGQPRSGRGLLASPVGWRVRTKLIAILAIPVIAIIVNALIDASSVLTSTRDINRVSDLININRAAMGLTYELERERTFTVDYVASKMKGTEPNIRPVEARREVVDRAYAAYQDVAEGKRGSFDDQVNEALEAVATSMDGIAAKRASTQRMTEAASVMEAYDSVIQPLISLVGLIPQGNDDRELVTAVDATEHLVSAADLLAQQQAQVDIYLVSGQNFSNDAYRAVLSLDSARSNELDEFGQSATPEQNALYANTVNNRTQGDVVNTAKYTSMVLDATVDQPLPEAIPQGKWLLNTKTTVELSYDVVDDMLDQISDRVDTLRGDIQQRALFSALFTILILAAALVITLVVAQSLVRPLFALRNAALDIAERRLPEAVRRLRDSSEQVVDDEIETVGIDTDEEIGHVARAFDQVHREAVKLASEQAVLRNNVNAMFVNLSRRSQGLVERQLRLIDDLENREQDPDQLANLFKLDHLATRMRRNNESLLVLAGTDTARRWTHPVPLNEVVLAAISEVEQYTRVKQTTAAPVSIAGNGVSDVVHLIAELLENATAYSPPATDVVVTSHSLGPGAGAMIEIVDQGIGIPSKDLERVNERLANPPVVDVSVSRTMGLFAVGRLASRHGIRVQLRESPSRGITAVIRLPAKLVTGDGNTTPAAPRPGGIGRPGVEGAPRPGAPALGGPQSGGRPELGAGPLELGAGRPELGSGPSAFPGGPPSGLPARQPQYGAPERYPTPAAADSGRGGPQQHRDDLDDRPEQDRFGPPSGGAPPTTDASRFGQPPLALPGGGQPGGPATGPMPMPMQDQRPRYREEDTQQFTSFPGSPRRPAGQDPQQRGFQPEQDERDFRDSPSGPQSGQVDLRGTPADWTGGYPAQRPMGPTDRTGPIPRPMADPVDRSYSNGFGSSPTGPRTGPQDSVFARPAARPDPAPVDVPRPRWEEQAAGPATGGYPRPSVENTGEHYVGDGEDVDTTPIFDSVSAWFQRSPGEEARRAPDPVVETTPPPSFVAPRASAGMRVMGNVNGTAEQPIPRAEPARADTGPRPPVQPVQPAAYLDAPSGPRIASTPSGPLPVRGPEPLPTRGAEPLPARGAEPLPTRGPEPLPARGAEPLPARGPEPLPTRGTASNSWESAGDAGWRAAEVLRQPGGAEASTTKAGLPMRVPMTHLVPGSAEPASNRKPPSRPVDPTMRSPEAVGGRLASFYQGVRQGRDMGAETRSARRDGQEER